MDAALGTVMRAPTAPRAQGDEAAQPAPVSRPVERKPIVAPDVLAAVDAKLNARREVISDPATDSLVYRMIDVVSGAVTSQTPTEARLRLRAYIDTVIAAQAVQATFESQA